MKCKHVHKDAPENAVCSDCYDFDKPKNKGQALFKAMVDDLNKIERRSK